MYKLRKKAAGLVGGAAPIPVTTSIRAKAPTRAPAASNKGKAKGRKPGGMFSDALRYVVTWSLEFWSFQRFELIERQR